ncbi:hypothetical protein [Pararhizobium sp.]|uniref:hypothetical protein n=1 Tax=Pararhizobium sp. TaxID=1977563 RepID=UPI0027264330|nr:hypothetical protein [Pararhizobium sp.]MDO9416121.1 hypothetical protein [Pararhizobium sp.]
MPYSFELETEKAIDTYMERNRQIKSRQAAVEMILKTWLGQNGYIGGGEGGTRPQDLDASNDD